MYLNRRSVQTATGLAILDFNSGLFGVKMVFDELGLEWSYRQKHFCEAKTVDKLKKAAVRQTEEFKAQRLFAKKLRNRDNRQTKKAEGKTYGAGLEADDVGLPPKKMAKRSKRK